jgi:hypothetical protein
MLTDVLQSEIQKFRAKAQSAKDPTLGDAYRDCCATLRGLIRRLNDLEPPVRATAHDPGEIRLEPDEAIFKL